MARLTCPAGPCLGAWHRDAADGDTAVWRAPPAEWAAPDSLGRKTRVLVPGTWTWLEGPMWQG